MIKLLSSISFLPTYPQLIVPVSQTKFGGRVVSAIETGDPYRFVDMKTHPMRAHEAVQLQSFIVAARGGINTIIYQPQHICIPRAYWGNPDSRFLNNTAKRGVVVDGYSVQLTGVVPGMQLMDGDLFSLQNGDYRQLLQVVYGGGATAVGTHMTVKVDQPIASYIAAGAIVKFKQPEMNTRLVKDSFQMTDGNFPTASFQLIEVPK